MGGDIRDRMAVSRDYHIPANGKPAPEGIVIRRPRDAVGTVKAQRADKRHKRLAILSRFKTMIQDGMPTDQRDGLERLRKAGLLDPEKEHTEKAALFKTLQEAKLFDEKRFPEPERPDYDNDSRAKIQKYEDDSKTIRNKHAMELQKAGLIHLEGYEPREHVWYIVWNNGDPITTLCSHNLDDFTFRSLIRKKGPSKTLRP